MDDLLREFLVETNESLDVADVELVRFEQEPNNAKILANIFRIVHTIKGTCGFIGLPRLETLAHAAETLMAKFRDGAQVTGDAVTLDSRHHRPHQGHSRRDREGRARAQRRGFRSDLGAQRNGEDGCGRAAAVHDAVPAQALGRNAGAAGAGAVVARGRSLARRARTRVPRRAGACARGGRSRNAGEHRAQGRCCRTRRRGSFRSARRQQVDPCRRRYHRAVDDDGVRAGADP